MRTRLRFQGGPNTPPGFSTTRDMDQLSPGDRVYVEPHLFVVASVRPMEGNPEFDQIAVLRVP